MFTRPHHQQIASVLLVLDAPLLARNHCLFAGGTSIALRYGEFRESVDIDFLVSDVAGYRALRQLLTGPQGLSAILRPGAALRAAREIRADQYGVRTLVTTGDVEIKFEIVLEGRIQLDAPGLADRICGVATLTEVDMVASKLLANSDRWADDSVFSRDVIDLAMMRPSRRLMEQGAQKARLAYGDSVQTDLHKAVTRLLEREGRLERCMQFMNMTVPRAVLLRDLKALLKK